MTQDADATFALRTAKGLIEDVDKETEEVVTLSRMADSEQRFWQGLQLQWSAATEAAKLRADLVRAIELARNASNIMANATLPDGTTSETIIAQAQFQAGLVDMGLGKWREAQDSFEASCDVIPTQEASLNAALSRLAQRRRVRFAPERLITLPISIALNIWNPFWYARLATVLREKRYTWAEWWVSVLIPQLFVMEGRYSKDEIAAGFAQVARMDTESAIAVEAGKWVARLT